MARHNELKIYASAVELSATCTLYAGRMNRNYRATIGQTLRQDCHAVVRRIQLANASKDADRIKHLEELRRTLGMIELSLRECLDRRIQQVNDDQYAVAIRLCDTVGRQATGWKRQTENALAHPAATAAGSMRS